MLKDIVKLSEKCIVQFQTEGRAWLIIEIVLLHDNAQYPIPDKT